MPVPAFPSASEAKHEEGFLHSADHVRLYWQRFTPVAAAPRATVAVIHGGGDHSGRYPALASGLAGAGFQVGLVDLRGHGQSDGRRWHVDAFGDYLGDVDAFVARLRADGLAGGKLFVVGHSMGALVAILWALERPGAAAGYVLSSPYLALAFPPPRVKLLAARTLGRVMPWLPVATGLKMSDLTSDEELQRWTDRDPLYGRVTTPRWFEEAGRAQLTALRRAPELVAPVLALVGSADGIAANAGARRFVDAAASTDKRLVVYDGFRHEIFNEVRRAEPIADTVRWLEAHA
jgi:alpha-beta hydrolase superfamily lysophospholipase